MTEAIQEAIKTGKFPYRYEYDTMSGVYFGAAVLFVIFVFALANNITKNLLK
jgi:hypothetical protein